MDNKQDISFPEALAQSQPQAQATQPQPQQQPTQQSSQAAPKAPRPRKKSRLSFIILMALMLVAFAAAGAIGFLYIQQQAQLSAAETQIATLQKQVAAEQATASAPTQTTSPATTTPTTTTETPGETIPPTTETPTAPTAPIAPVTTSPITYLKISKAAGATTQTASLFYQEATATGEAKSIDSFGSNYQQSVGNWDVAPATGTLVYVKDNALWVSVGGADLRKVYSVDKGSISNPVVSADGQDVMYYYFFWDTANKNAPVLSEFHKIKIDGTGDTKVYATGMSSVTLTLQGWSMDKKRVYATATCECDGNPEGMSVIDVAAGTLKDLQIKNLYAGGARNGVVNFNADHSKIAFVTRTFKDSTDAANPFPTEIGPWGISVYDIATGTTTAAFSTTTDRIQSVYWPTDGNLFFISNNRQIKMLNMSTKAITFVTTTLEQTAVWGIAQISADQIAYVLAVLDTNGQPTKVVLHTINIDGRFDTEVTSADGIYLIGASK